MLWRDSTSVSSYSTALYLKNIPLNNEQSRPQIHDISIWFWLDQTIHVKSQRFTCIKSLFESAQKRFMCNWHSDLSDEPFSVNALASRNIDAERAQYDQFWYIHGGVSVQRLSSSVNWCDENRRQQNASLIGMPFRCWLVKHPKFNFVAIEYVLFTFDMLFPFENRTPDSVSQSLSSFVGLFDWSTPLCHVLRKVLRSLWRTSAPL